MSCLSKHSVFSCRVLSVQFIIDIFTRDKAIERSTKQRLLLIKTKSYHLRWIGILEIIKSKTQISQEVTELGQFVLLNILWGFRVYKMLIWTVFCFYIACWMWAMKFIAFVFQSILPLLYQFSVQLNINTLGEFLSFCRGDYDIKCNICNRIKIVYLPLIAFELLLNFNCTHKFPYVEDYQHSEWIFF